MKILIDISEQDMDKVKHSDGALFADVYRMMANTIQNAIPLNGTNGEVLKAVFPNDSINFLIVNMERNDWLNADYKGVE